MADVATIDDIVDRAHGRAFQLQAIAVQQKDADDDGWVTETKKTKTKETEKKKMTTTAKKWLKCHSDEVWGSLGEWARCLCRDDMRKTGLLLLEFYRRLRPISSATTAPNFVGLFLSCSGRTIRSWRQQYSNNRGDFDEDGRGKY